MTQPTFHSEIIQTAIDAGMSPNSMMFCATQGDADKCARMFLDAKAKQQGKADQKVREAAAARRFRKTATHPRIARQHTSRTATSHGGPRYYPGGAQIWDEDDVR